MGHAEGSAWNVERHAHVNNVHAKTFSKVTIGLNAFLGTLPVTVVMNHYSSCKIWLQDSYLVCLTMVEVTDE